MAILGPALAVAMFLAASQMSMVPAAVVTLIVAAAGVFCVTERFLNAREHSLARGLTSSTMFCVTLSAALWLTTGHPGVLMWVIFATSVCSALTTIAGRYFIN